MSTTTPTPGTTPTPDPAGVIRLPLTPELIAGLRATLAFAFAATDAVTPQICAVMVTRRYLYATDRYTIGRYEHTTYAESVERHGEEGPSDPDFEVLVPREVAEQITKHKVDGAQVLVLTPGVASIKWHDGTSDTPLPWEPIPGIFPPVERLITEATKDDAEVSPLMLGNDRLAQLVKAGRALARYVGGANPGWRFQLPDARTARRNAPIRASLGDRLVVMVQSMIEAR